MPTNKRPPSLADLRDHKEEAAPHIRESVEVGEVTPLGKPDNVPADVWALVQDNGRLATERLNEILGSPRFHRMKASDQARFIKLAQDRAYGQPGQANDGNKKGLVIDITAQEMAKLAKRAELPEYMRKDQNVRVHGQDEEAGDNAGEPDDPGEQD